MWSALVLQATHLRVPCDKAPLSSGFQSFCPNHSTAALLLWFLGALLLSVVSLSSFRALRLKYAH